MQLFFEVVLCKHKWKSLAFLSLFTQRLKPERIMMLIIRIPAEETETAICIELISVLSLHDVLIFLCGISLLLCFCLSVQDVQIVSTDENQVFVALQEWYQTDTYNLYQSDPQGVYYSIVLENVRSTKQPEENVLIDILEVSISPHTVPV